MLVLTREKGQSIVIGGGIEVSILAIRGDKVRLGITAPTEIPVYRKELFETIKRNTPVKVSDHG
jgi:carbon storage regulator